jgi:hypothetical protein
MILAPGPSRLFICVFGNKLALEKDKSKMAIVQLASLVSTYT